MREAGMEPTAVRRVRAVEEAHDGSPVTVATTSGDVHIESLTTHEDGTRSYVDVRLAGETEGGDPSFRIVNPPTLVPDPAGDVEILGQRFRYDPIAAVAFVIAESGGAASKAKNGRRGR
jgi:hypothetical protein